MDENLKDRIAIAVGYLGGISVIVWALLKATGVINTPVWIEMIPYIGAAISIIAFAYNAGRAMEKISSKIDLAEKDIGMLKTSVSKLENSMAYVLGILSKPTAKR